MSLGSHALAVDSGVSEFGAFTLKTSSVSIIWELVNTIIHPASPYSELLGWTQKSVSSRICPPGDSVATSSLETAASMGSAGRESFLMLFWVKEGNIHQEEGTQLLWIKWRLQNADHRDTGVEASFCSFPLWPQVFTSGRPWAVFTECLHGQLWSTQADQKTWHDDKRGIWEVCVGKAKLILGFYLGLFKKKINKRKVSSFLIWIPHVYICRYQEKTWVTCRVGLELQLRYHLKLKTRKRKVWASFET